MSELWSSLTGPGQIFFVIAFISSIILLIQFLLTLIGLGVHDADVHAPDVGGEHGDFIEGSGLGVLSVRTVIAFFVGFGWTGTILIHYNRTANTTKVSAISFAVGTVFLLIVYWMMKFISSLAEQGNIDMKRAVGKTGTVYIPIKKKGENTGQIQAVVQGRLREISAITDEEVDLPTGTPVEIIQAITNNTMLVRRINVKV